LRHAHPIRYTLLSLRDLLASIGPFALLTLPCWP
jgi:hypothetical protein